MKTKTTKRGEWRVSPFTNLVPTGGEFDEEDEGMPEAGVGLAGNESANPVDSEVRRTHAHERAGTCI
jgi:hypothetical protein